MISTGKFALFASSLAVGAALLMPGSALAQGNAAAAAAADVCDVSETSPTEVGRAFLSLQNAVSDTARESRLRSTRSVIQSASLNMEKGVNLAGRSFIMAKAMMLILQVPNFPVKTTRGEIGFQIQPAEPVDLIVAIDSLFTSVETSNPRCAAEIQSWRFSQPWVDLLQKATDQLKIAKDTTTPTDIHADSAERLVNRAQILERKSPYTWQLKASIATRRNDAAKSIEFWKKTYEAAGSDTANLDMRLQALYFMGETNMGQAAIASKAGKDSVAPSREAAKHFKQFLVEAGTHKDAPAARANLMTAFMTAGDTVAAAEVYADLIANPAKYTSQDHLQAGVAATNMKKTEDAVKLFENALLASPFDRDALFNVSVSLFTAKMFPKMLELTSRLVQVDPNNPDNLQMLAYAYAMLEPTEPDAVKKKQYADSLFKYNDWYEKLTKSHAVRYAYFQKTENATMLTGTVQNAGTAERTFKLEFDFLDDKGNVVDSKAVDVVVKAGETKQFDVKVDRGKIIAFKNKAIPPFP